MSIQEIKRSLRQQMREKRHQLSATQQLQLGQQLVSVFQAFVSRNDFPASLYLSFDSELDTKPLIEYAWQNNLPIYLPLVIAPGQPLCFCHYSPETVLSNNQYGIPEPVATESVTADSMACIFLPLTAFDRRGGRLGMGGGYYDRTLAEITSGVKLVGLAYGFQEVSDCPTEATDQPLDWILTPDEAIDCQS